MVLESVEKLSDDAGPSGSGTLPTREEPTAKAKPKATPKTTAKAKPKAKSSGNKPKKNEQDAAKGSRDELETEKETEGTPKTEQKKPKQPKSPPMKRPASSSGSSAKVLKRPSKMDADRVSAGKSMYKRDGVWSVKYNGAEVVRVFRLHLGCFTGRFKQCL